MKQAKWLIGLMSVAGLMTLTACSTTTIAPAEQVQKGLEKQTASAAPLPRSVVKKQITHEYRCKKGKIVRVQSAADKKNGAITVSFNQSSYKLSPAVSSKGKKYSNIRWIWREDFNGVGTLQDNRNNLLAEVCLRK